MRSRAMIWALRANSCSVARAPYSYHRSCFFAACGILCVEGNLGAGARQVGRDILSVEARWSGGAKAIINTSRAGSGRVSV